MKLQPLLPPLPPENCRKFHKNSVHNRESVTQPDREGMLETPRLQLPEKTVKNCFSRIPQQRPLHFAAFFRTQACARKASRTPLKFFSARLKVIFQYGRSSCILGGSGGYFNISCCRLSVCSINVYNDPYSIILVRLCNLPI